jgi:hypothetical protein
MIRFLLLWVWQFPQKLLGTILIKVLKAEMDHYGVTFPEGKYWHYKRNSKFSKFISGVSLADIILLSDDTCNMEISSRYSKPNNIYTVRHEYGHSRQSMYLGWLYLPVVGIYSALFCNLFDRIAHKKWCQYDRHYWYYKTRWTEKWADSLGGVNKYGAEYGRDYVLSRIPRPDGARYPQVYGKE